MKHVTQDPGYALHRQGPIEELFPWSVIELSEDNDQIGNLLGDSS